jgi:hypothetical protein
MMTGPDHNECGESKRGEDNRAARKYDQQFAVVFQAIRGLMKPPTAKPKEIG